MIRFDDQWSGWTVVASKGDDRCSCVNRCTGINFRARIVNRFPVFTDHQFRGVGHYELHGGGLSGRERRVVARRCAGIDRAGHENQIAGSSGARDRLGRPKGQGDVSVPGQKRQGERTSYSRTEAWRYIRMNLFKGFRALIMSELKRVRSFVSSWTCLKIVCFHHWILQLKIYYILILVWCSNYFILF